jgi:hypothetical protein
MSDLALDQVVELALQLSAAEQAKLLERVAAHLARDLDEPEIESDALTWTDEELAELLKPSTPKTGAEIAAMIRSGELGAGAWSEMAHPEMTDSVEWVKALRRQIAK